MGKARRESQSEGEKAGAGGVCDQRANNENISCNGNNAGKREEEKKNSGAR